MSIHPPEARLVHPLPAAPHFVGREPELETLRAWWSDGSRGVLALVGLGGAGKTTVAARFLDELLSSNHRPRPEGLFVWSFYQDPDPGRFVVPPLRPRQLAGQDCSTSSETPSRWADPTC
jgi:hypothetical protein